MKDSKLILEKLRENNPFASSSDPLPWSNTNPILAQLNREVLEDIEQLIRYKRREPAHPLSGLILGQAGSGKTHMLMRILQRLRGKETLAVLVTIGTFRVPELITHDLLHNIFTSFKQQHSKGRSQFDMLTSEVMNVYRERRNEDGYHDLSKLDIRVYLAKDMPELDSDFLKGFLLYAGTDDEAVKLNVLEWLEHGLDEDESQRLGLPLRNTISMSDLKREDDAEKMLLSIGCLLSYAKIPMIICFDQLDHLRRNKPLIHAWGDLISLLVNAINGVLPLCFFTPETWTNDIVPELPAPVIQRLTGNRIIMNACTTSQAYQLIRDRIALAFKNEQDTEEAYQCLMGRMRSSINPSMSPRRIIQQVNRIITGDDTDIQDESQEILRTIRAVYEEEYKKVQEEPKDWPPNSENLTLTLKLWLESHEGFEIQKGEGKYIKLTGKYREEKFAFVVCAQRHNAVAGAAFKRGNKFFTECPSGKCFYITEDIVNKPTWRKVNELRSDFENSGGHVIMLDRNTRINWYALTALIDRMDNGDVNVYLPSGTRTASRDDIKNFISTIELIPGIFNVTTRPENVPHDTRPDILAMNLKSLLKSSPMYMITVSKAIEMLSRRKIIVSREELVSYLKSSTGVFKTYAPNDGDTLIAFSDRN